VWSVGRSVTIMSPANTAKPPEMLFGMWIRVGALDGGPDPHSTGQF